MKCSLGGFSFCRIFKDFHARALIIIASLLYLADDWVKCETLIQGKRESLVLSILYTK